MEKLLEHDIFNLKQLKHWLGENTILATNACGQSATLLYSEFNFFFRLIKCIVYKTSNLSDKTRTLILVSFIINNI